MVIIKKEVLNFLGYFHFESFLCCITVMCNFQCVLLVDSNCTNVLVCLCSNFFFFLVYLLLMLVTWFLNQ